MSQNTKKCAFFFYLQAPFGCHYFYTKEVSCFVSFCLFLCLFLFQNEAPQRVVMMVRSLPTKKRKNLSHDVFDTLATHAGSVHDVKDTDCWAQNGSAHGRVFANFERRLLKNKTINQAKNCCVSIFYFIPVHWVRGTSSLEISFNVSGLFA